MITQQESANGGVSSPLNAGVNCSGYRQKEEFPSKEDLYMANK